MIVMPKGFGLPQEQQVSESYGGFGEGLYDLADQFGRLRYGVPTSEKERMAVSGEVPGAQPIQYNDRDVARENRRAAAYLFGKTWPRLAPVIQPAINRFKDYAPFFTDDEDSEALHNIALEAVRRGSQDSRY